MDAFFVFSRNAANENSPQFQLRVKWKRAESRRDERILRVFFLPPLPGLGDFCPADPRLKPWAIVGRASSAGRKRGALRKFSNH
jgi:hypothetical protein